MLSPAQTATPLSVAATAKGAAASMSSVQPIVVFASPAMRARARPEHSSVTWPMTRSVASIAGQRPDGCYRQRCPLGIGLHPCLLIADQGGDLARSAQPGRFGAGRGDVAGPRVDERRVVEHDVARLRERAVVRGPFRPGAEGAQRCRRARVVDAGDQFCTVGVGVERGDLPQVEPARRDVDPGALVVDALQHRGGAAARAGDRPPAVGAGVGEEPLVGPAHRCGLLGRRGRDGRRRARRRRRHGHRGLGRRRRRRRARVRQCHDAQRRDDDGEHDDDRDRDGPTAGLDEAIDCHAFFSAFPARRRRRGPLPARRRIAARRAAGRHP